MATAETFSSSSSNNTIGRRPRAATSSSAATTTPSKASAAAATSASSSSCTFPLDDNNHPSTPLRRLYFSRRQLSRLPPGISHSTDKEDGFIGIYSPWAVLWGMLFLTVPFCYIYISLVLMRELCCVCPETIHAPIQYYLPQFSALIDWMSHQSYRIVEYWCWIEGIFYLWLKLYISHLQRKDPLEASLSAAPLMDVATRHVLWSRMMECEQDDPVSWLSGWFFDVPMDSISKYDVRDFLTWSMFEGRHQEHLSTAELEQLERFVDDLEYRISLQLYGVQEEDVEEPVVVVEGSNDDDEEDNNTDRFSTSNGEAAVGDERLQPSLPRSDGLAQPKKMFRFNEETNQDEPTHFFFDLYESYKNRYEQMVKSAPDFHPVQDLREMVKNTAPDFHPVQDLKNLMAETAQQISHAEESAMATASQVYETLVPSGSAMEKQLSAMSHATYVQFTEAWNSVKNIKDRLKTARFLSKQRQRIRQQLKGYRVMLNRMMEMSSAVPSKQMAAMMRRITECNQSLELLESRAQSAFCKATGFAMSTMPLFCTATSPPRVPQHYARYSSDPLLGIATYPLGFHLLVLGATEIPLRIMLHQRGFERRTIGAVSYYVHPGRSSPSEMEDELSENGCAAAASSKGENKAHNKGDEGKRRRSSDDDDDDEENSRTPIIFVHGIGIGLIVYMHLIDKLLETGRPLLLPEIPYVSGFRPWQSPSSVLSPATVASTMSAMLATHGYMRGTWVGHSYGTSWLSYMMKFASHAVAAILFLDPICFCLHVPRLTKSFVYMRADPGMSSYMVRTDIMVNWTIQRSFPWVWMVLFVEQVETVPCSVFLSDKDALVPATKVEDYLRKKNVPVCDFDSVTDDHFSSSMLNCTVFRGDGHGGWTERPRATVPTIASAVEILCRRAEQMSQSDKNE